MAESRVGFTVRTDPAFPQRVIVDTRDGDGLQRSFVLTIDDAYWLQCRLEDALEATRWERDRRA